MSETEKRAAERADPVYFETIETAFIRRRGTPFLLSPKDYELARRWRALGIPVEDVCAGIEDAFDRRAERGASGRVNSLSYCEGAVLEAWERRASARVGRSAEAGAADVSEALRALGEAFGAVPDRFAAATASARRAIERLAASGKDPEDVERSLSRIDRRLLRAVEESLAADERARIEAAVDTRLGADAAGMAEEARRRTRDVLVRQRLRSAYGLPRLTLLT